MQNAVILLTSITYVNKAKYILSENNIKSYIIKMRTTYERPGCGYGLEIPENYLSASVSLIEKHRIKIVEIINNH